LSREEKQRYDALLHDYRELQKSIEEKSTRIYTKDFIYFVVSMLLPLGYGEVDLISRVSVWHVVFGWLCWAVPSFIGGQILWRWLASKKIIPSRRIIAITAIAIIFFGLATKSVLAFINRQQEEQQEEVKRNLVTSVLPPLTENVMESVFSVTNRSSRTTIGSGTLFCGINQLLGENKGVPVNIGQLSTTAVPNASRLVPGDSRSEPCLMLWSNLVQTAKCVDMDLSMKYTIEPQPESEQEKVFRLVGYQSRGGQFNWYPEPTSSQLDYCDYFRRQTAAPN
jgi:hypothetical protein